MTEQEFHNGLHLICAEANSALKNLIIQARTEEFGYWDGSVKMPWADEEEWQRELDSLVEACGFVYDRANGRNRLSRNSTIKKLRKALGYNTR